MSTVDNPLCISFLNSPLYIGNSGFKESRRSGSNLQVIIEQINVQIKSINVLKISFVSCIIENR